MRDTEILIVAVFFAACHLFSPWLFTLQERVGRQVASFSGGLASAYVFLHLLPEIDEGGELLGPRIYFILLIGLAAYYGVEILIHRTQTGERGEKLNALVHFAIAAVYTCLLQFTLGEQLPTTIALTLTFATTMGLHLVSTDFGLQEEYQSRYVSVGRYILVAAVIVGYSLSFIREPREEVVDALTALLAGFMIFKVFRKELPEFRNAHFAAFLSGMALFLAAHLLLSADGETEPEPVSALFETR